MGLEIEKKLSRYGFNMLGDEKEIIELIKDISESENERYLKAIPYLIYKYNLNDNELKSTIKNKKKYEWIISLTKKIFDSENIKNDFPNIKKEIKDYEEYLQEFRNQKKINSQSNLLIDKQKINAERQLEFSLSKIFTEKEKEIIKKIIDEKTLTKTEYEYYSRKTKKKLESITILNDFAKTIYNKKTIREQTNSN